MAIFEMYNTTVSCTYDFYDVLFCNNVLEKKKAALHEKICIYAVYTFISLYIYMNMSKMTL